MKKYFTEKKRIFISILVFLVLLLVVLESQNLQDIKQKSDVELENTDKPEKFTEYFKQITIPMNKKESGYEMNYKVSELRKAKRAGIKSRNLSWIQRGPANVGGRTRAVVVDMSDDTYNTWIVGAASGGIWKTTDGGATWEDLSAELSNLSVNALAMAESDHNILYAGTGESFPGGTYLRGNGIWKSTDGGATWQQLENTVNNDFAYVNRVVVNRTDANIVTAATETGIFKSTDGGNDWTKVYASYNGVSDIVTDPENEDIMYAGENSVGVLKSTDAGSVWTKSGRILGAARYELAVSPVNSNYVFVSAAVDTEVSHLYMSDDKGITWKQMDDTQSFLGDQGEYDNTIAAHPYNVDEVFVGGVDIWNVKFNGTSSMSDDQIINIYSDVPFMSFVNFGGDYLGGGLSTEGNAGEWSDIEIRFGSGLTQKAHRFTVPANSTSGVPDNDYTYQDYVDVPFQVWNTNTNTQLMVSFRDQEQDGEFNLYVPTGASTVYGVYGREYIFVSSEPYDATTPSSNIAVDGGHVYKNLFMIWSVLQDAYTWDPDNLPSSKITIDYGQIELMSGEKTCVADGRNQYGGANYYNQSAGYGTTAIPGLHPDHHNITLIPTGGDNFKMINSNDGGLGISDDNAVTISTLPNNYLTTQFYGVSKNPEANEYIGGMQDNGTWQSQAGEDASSSSQYLFRIGGDGFECLWNAKDPQRLLGSVYNNAIYKSSNGGASWSSVSGIFLNDGPFITHISASKANPDVVFAVGKYGVYKSEDFGANWRSRPISNNWIISDIGITSAHNVEVSLANGNIVWAGAAMTDNYNIQLSTDEGESFKPVSNYTEVDMNVYISGIATHPTQDSTAYILFSGKGMPKVIRTTDLGQTWEDISGFGTNSESSNGFPDVVVHSLLVMPHDLNTIWVGTDIGLFESNDNGQSWHIADNGLPAVSVYDMQITGNQVVVATHGRGIWTVDIPEIDNMPYLNTFERVEGATLQINADFKVQYDSAQVYLNGSYYSTVDNPAVGNTDIQFVVASTGQYRARIFGYLNGEAYESNPLDLNVTSIGTESLSKQDFKLYPNPNFGKFNVNVDAQYKSFTLKIHDLLGKECFSKEYINSGTNLIEVNSVEAGSYIVTIYANEHKYSKMIQIIN